MCVCLWAWVCVCSATDPKVINSANTFVLTQSRGEVFLGVYLTSHYLLCIDCLSHEEQHENTWNGLLFFFFLPFITFGEKDNNSAESEASTEKYLYRLIIPILKNICQSSFMTTVYNNLFLVCSD